MRAYVDSCLHIYALEGHERWAIPTRDLLRGEGYELCYSQLVVMECLVVPLRRNDARLVDRYVTAVGRTTKLPITDEVYLLAAELRASAPGLKTPDAIHLACAIYHGCDEFWTNDERGLATAAAGRLRVRTLTR